MDTLSTPIPPAHYASIGKLVVNFSILEHRVQVLVWTLLNASPGQAQVVTTQLSFDRLVKVAKALYRLRVTAPDRLANMKAVMNAAGQAEQDRNTLIHSLWLAGPDSHQDPWRTKLTTDEKAGLGVQDQQVPVEKVDAVSERVAASALAVLQLAAEFQGEGN